MAPNWYGMDFTKSQCTAMMSMSMFGCASARFTATNLRGLSNISVMAKTQGSSCHTEIADRKHVQKAPARYRLTTCNTK